MGEIWHRFVENIVLRFDGPFHFRFIVQPLMAAGFAIVDGLRDARGGRPAYFWTVAVDPEHRRDLLREGWRRSGRIFILAVIIDLAYKWRVDRGFFPGETLVVALFLAIVPYVVLRGPVNRVARLLMKPKAGE